MNTHILPISIMAVSFVTFLMLGIMTFLGKLDRLFLRKAVENGTPPSKLAIIRMVLGLNFLFDSVAIPGIIYFVFIK